MQVYSIKPKGFCSNSYILTADGKNAVVIDCSSVEVLDKCKSLNLVPRYVLLTHCHFDHTRACQLFQSIGAVICCNEREFANINSPVNLYEEYGEIFHPYHIDRTFKDGETFELCGIRFTAISTAGHTNGSMSYLAENCIFTGDTLFKECIGRTDLPTSSSTEILASCKKILNLQGNLTIYPGHGFSTTSEHERSNNPYL